MFSELVESVPAQARTKKPWTMAISALVQCLGLSILILMPLIYTAALPQTITSAVSVVPFAPHRSPSPQRTAQPLQPRGDPTRTLSFTPVFAPNFYPPHAQKIQDEPPEVGAPSDDSLAVIGDGLIAISIAPVIRPLAPAREPATPPPARLRVGGVVESAKLISRIQPAYPPFAVTARVQGDVVLHAIIAKDGSIAELQAVSGPPPLIRAALDAVRQWRYQPTLLNGVPVEVDTTVTVTFILNR